MKWERVFYYLNEWLVSDTRNYFRQGRNASNNKHPVRAYGTLQTK